jgi:inner membrane protein
MTGKTHLLGGLLFTTGASLVMVAITKGSINSYLAMIPLVAGGELGAYLPDIDHPSSHISRRLPFIASLFRDDRRKKWKAAHDDNLTEEEKAAAELAYEEASHRGRTHYLLPWAVVLAIGLVAFLVGKLINNVAVLGVAIFLLGVFAGALSHLLLDMISGQVPILAPFIRTEVGVRIFKTGGNLERILFRLILLALNLVIWYELLMMFIHR